MRLRPKISFVIPCFNKAGYIAECLESLINQTLKEIEIIIVNDGSIDNSKEIIKFYIKKDKRIRFFDFKKNRGRSQARNYGNKKATADIICVLDADDLAVKERAEVIHKYFKKYPKTDVFYGSFYVSDMYGKILGGIKAIKFDLDRVKTTGVTYIGHSTMAYKKTAIMTVKYTGGEYSKLGLDDWKLQMDLYKAGYKFGFVEIPLMIYRQLSDSISAVRNATDVYKQKGKYFESFKKAV